MTLSDKRRIIKPTGGFILNDFFDENDFKDLFESAPKTPVVGSPAKPSTESIKPEVFADAPTHPADVFENANEVRQNRVKIWLLGIWRIIWKFALLFVLIFVASFSLINYPAISKQFGYFYTHSFTAAVPTPTPAPPTPIFDPSAPARLNIPKLGTNAPIIWNVPEDNFNDQLLNGVVQFKGTALPGQNGNIFITGHSSYYSWVKSDYKDVFALLDKLTVGDSIYIQYNLATYTYTVTGAKVVSADNLEVLGSGYKPTLTLMTCVPVGTNLNRLVVSADQVSVSGQFYP